MIFFLVNIACLILVIWLPIHLIKQKKTRDENMIKLMQEQNELLRKIKEKE